MFGKKRRNNIRTLNSLSMNHSIRLEALEIQNDILATKIDELEQDRIRDKIKEHDEDEVTVDGHIRRCCQQHVTSIHVKSPTQCRTCGRHLAVRDSKWVQYSPPPPPPQIGDLVVMSVSPDTETPVGWTRYDKITCYRMWTQGDTGTYPPHPSWWVREMPNPEAEGPGIDGWWNVPTAKKYPIEQVE